MTCSRWSTPASRPTWPTGSPPCESGRRARRDGSTADLRRCWRDGADRLLGGRGARRRRHDARGCWRQCSASRRGELRRLTAWSTTCAADAVRRARRGVGRPRAAAAPHRHAPVPAPRARGRAGCVRAAPRDRAAGRVGGRRLRRLVAAGTAPVAVDLCTGSGAVALALAAEAVPRRGCTRSSCRRTPRVRRAARTLGRAPASTCGWVTSPTRRTALRPGRHGRRRRRQPAVHPAGRVRGGGPRGPRPRPARGAVVRRRRSGRDPARRRASPPAAARRGGLVVCEHADVQGERRPRCSSRPGRWREVRDHRDLAGAAAVRHRRGAVHDPVSGWHDGPVSAQRPAAPTGRVGAGVDAGRAAAERLRTGPAERRRRAPRGAVAEVYAWTTRRARRASRGRRRSGELVVVMPTDTVYGLAADAFEPPAYAAAARPRAAAAAMPPPVLVGDADTLDALATELDRGTRALAEEFWPGRAHADLPPAAEPAAGTSATAGRHGRRRGCPTTRSRSSCWTAPARWR